MNKECSIESCTRDDYWARGYCRHHYDRWLRTGDPVNTKIAPCPAGCVCGRHADNKGKPKVQSLPCLACGKTRPVMFSRGPDGRDPSKYCDRVCYEQHRKERIATRRAMGICRIYDMSNEEFEERFAAQGGVCAICMKPISKSAHRDHCHKSGEWRGLLCGPCNTGLGMFGDDPDTLSRAWAYLLMGGVPVAEKT